jgi:hypothetical protein
LGGLALDRGGFRPEELLRTMALLVLLPGILWSLQFLRGREKS